MFSRHFSNVFWHVSEMRPSVTSDVFGTLFCANTVEHQFQLVRTQEVVMQFDT